MPAKTPAQRKLFGAALAAKRGAEPISKKVADIASKTSEKELSKMASKPKKKKKNEGVEGTIDQVYMVQKPYSGCQLTSLVHPVDPLKGLEGSEIVPDQIHGVYPDQETAGMEAEKIYNEHVQYEQTLEEKKHKITEKIKKVMKTLEKERAECNEIIRENPKDSMQQKNRVAELTHKLDELVSTLERVEKSKKEMEEKKHDKEEVKKSLKEALKKSLKEAYEVHFSDGVRQKKIFNDEKSAINFAKQLINKNKQIINTNKKLQYVDVFKAGPKFHSTADTDSVIAWWGDGSYMDNKAEQDHELASKKIQ